MISVLCAVALSSADHHIDVEWTEGGDRRGAVRFELNTSVALTSSGGTATIKVTESGSVIKSVSYSLDLNVQGGEFDYALPIRVRGSQRPQVLVRQNGPNWMYYTIYSIGDSGLSEVYGNSCRDEAAIKWVDKKGELVQIIEHDRWNEMHNPRGMDYLHKRWENRREYRWSAGTWKETSSKWIPFEMGSFRLPMKNPVVKDAESCPFLYER